MPIIYLDVCCLNRLFNDQAQERIRLETQAVVQVLARAHRNEDTWVSSEVVGREIEQTPDPNRRRRVNRLTRWADRSVLVNEPEEARAAQLEALGFHPFDALHLACAESGGADIFLTVDDRLIRTARRHATHLRLRVVSPVVWLEEVRGGEDQDENA